jgi:pilus assembly protein FimV
VQLDVAESTAIERGLDLLLPDVDLDVSESADKNEAISLDVTEAEELVTPPVSELTESEPVPLVTRINPDTLLNFDFEFDASPAAAPANLAEPDLVEQSVEAAPISLDFGGISLDLDTQTAEAGVKDAPAEIELTMDDIDNADEDPIDIKISLARAYMDMGDRDSANEILQEVLDEGNATQGKLAREMLEDMRSAA